jgi:hypothetical protein
MPNYSSIKFRDTRTGRWRRPAAYESNKNFKIDTLSKGMANFVFKTNNALAEKAQDFAAELVSYAKNNAPWEDRTGAARQGLEGEVEIGDDQFTITLSHTVEYGIWLEIRWGGRYAIIIPTVETMGPKLWNKVQGIVGDIVYYE